MNNSQRTTQWFKRCRKRFNWTSRSMRRLSSYWEWWAHALLASPFQCLTRGQKSPSWHMTRTQWAHHTRSLRLLDWACWSALSSSCSRVAQSWYPRLGRSPPSSSGSVSSVWLPRRHFLSLLMTVRISRRLSAAPPCRRLQTSKRRVPSTARWCASLVSSTATWSISHCLGRSWQLSRLPSVPHSPA